MADPINIELEIDLKDNGGKWRFTTLEEVEQWATSERQAWAWMNDACRRDSNLEQVRRTQTSHWDEALNRINRVRHQPEGQRPRYVQDIGSWLEQNYTQNKILHSACTIAKHVETIQSQDLVLAAYALGFYLGVQGNGSPLWQRGAFLALAQEYGLHDTANAESAQLADVQRKWDAFKAASEKAFSDFQSQFTAALQAIETERTVQQEQWQKTMAGYKAGFEDHIKTARGELNAIAKTYDEKLALQASVTYWKLKAGGHMRQSIGYAIAVFIAMIAVGLGLYRTMELTVGTEKLADVQLWKLGMLAIIATVGVWFIRVLVRLLLSHVHLHTDALERRTMLLTYLALLRRQKLPDTEERRLILQSLFRPTVTGIVKDDASPPFMAQWLKQWTGGE